MYICLLVLFTETQSLTNTLQMALFKAGKCQAGVSFEAENLFSSHTYTEAFVFREKNYVIARADLYRAR